MTVIATLFIVAFIAWAVRYEQRREPNPLATVEDWLREVFA